MNFGDETFPRDLRSSDLTRDSIRDALLQSLPSCCGSLRPDVLASEVAVLELLDSADGALVLLIVAGLVVRGRSQPEKLVTSVPDQPLTILCADDHTLVGDALMKIFSTAGYRVERASDGEEAWQKLSVDLRQFDVLITDHEMPRLTGLQLVGRLRDTKYPGRIIVHSAGLTDEDAALYRGMGVEAIVVKTPDAAKLLGVVKALHRQE